MFRDSDGHLVAAREKVRFPERIFGGLATGCISRVKASSCGTHSVSGGGHVGKEL